MQVIWQEFLKALGTRVNPDIGVTQVCPMHEGAANNPSLTVSFDPITTEPYFTCCDPRCNFHGNAVTVIKRKLGLVSLQRVLATFKPGAQYWSTLTPEAKADPKYVERYSMRWWWCRQVHEKARHYADMCSCRLNDAQDGALAREVLHAVSGVHIPPDVGLYINKWGQPINEHIVDFDSHRLTYPYTYNHKLVSTRTRSLDALRDWNPVAAQATINIQNTHVTNNLGHTYVPGVFMESNIAGATEAYVTLSELDACALYSNFKLHSLKSPPVAGIVGFPLPSTFKHLERLFIVVFKNSPWNLSAAMDLLNSPAVIEGVTNIRVNVMHVPYDISALPPLLHRALQTYDHIALSTWISMELYKMCALGDYAGVTAVMDAARLVADAKKRLRRDATKIKLHDEDGEYGLTDVEYAYRTLVEFHRNSLSPDTQVLYTADRYRKRIAPQLLEAAVKNADAQLAPLI